MRFLNIIFLALTSFVSSAQNLKEKELKTTIEEVTVFLDAAQIFERGKVSVPQGKNLIRVKNISPFIDEKSIQVKAEGSFTILSINHRLNYLDAVKKDRIIDSLNAEIEKLQELTTNGETRLQVLKEKQELLDVNEDLGGTSGVSIAQIKQAMDFYEAELSKIKDEEMRIKKSISKRGEVIARLNAQLKEQNDRKILPTSEIEIRTSSDANVDGTFSITYLVANAGWFPKYDVRVSNITSPLQLTYKAEVYQNTGVDWKNVKLRFSNGRPNQSGVAPELPSWLLNYARFQNFKISNQIGFANTGAVKGQITDEFGKPMPGVSVIIKGTAIGSSTDMNGRYSLTLPHPNATLVISYVGYSSQEVAVTRPEVNVTLNSDATSLNEVVTMGYANQALQGSVAGVQTIRIRGISSIPAKATAEGIPSTFVETQTTVEIVVDVPYSIKSDGEKLMVDLRKYEIPAEYEYYAVPKLDKDAFLTARIVKWDQYNLLEGEANLYFEDAFIGRSVLNAKAISDTLNISLGRDKSIVIARTEVEQFSKKKFIGSNTTESRGFKFVVRNKKSQPIKITLYDQIPVSVNSEITVEATELSNGKLNEGLGKITWTYIIPPQQQKEFDLQYEVKYPKREHVVLE